MVIYLGNSGKKQYTGLDIDLGHKPKKKQYKFPIFYV